MKTFWHHEERRVLITVRITGGKKAQAEVSKKRLLDKTDGT